MGIPDLFSFINLSKKKVSLCELRGKRVAVDGFIWLHKVGSKFAKEIYLDPKTEVIIPHLRNKLRVLIESGIIPIIVFDGINLPSKARTNSMRQAQREDAGVMAMELERLGKHKDALAYFQKAVSIVSETVLTWIKDLKNFGVEYIVSPFEADAQMVYLERTGYVDAVMTEDSDIIAYGCGCTLTKFNEYQKTVELYFMSDILRDLELNYDDFNTICILSGCDYVESIRNMGLKTAYKLLKEGKDVSDIISFCRSKPKFSVPNEYERMFDQAKTTFMCAPVYDPNQKILTYLSDPPSPLPEYLGYQIPPDILKNLVAGLIDTRTFQYIGEPQSQGPTSPYFGKTSEVSSVHKCETSSKYFKGYTSGNGYQTQSKITSYLNLAN